MLLKLYNTDSETNRINKVLTDETEFDVRLKDKSSVVNPVLLLKSETYINFNYAYIPKFQRYYFVDDISVYPNKMYILTLRCDVLTSFKDDILKSYARIVEQTNSNAYYDSNLKSEVRKEVDTYMSDVSFDLTADSMVLVTIGGCYYGYFFNNRYADWF